jgi:hypothetical protein
VRTYVSTKSVNTTVKSTGTQLKTAWAIFFVRDHLCKASMAHSKTFQKNCQ